MRFFEPLVDNMPLNRYLLGFLYPISRLISYSVLEKVMTTCGNSCSQLFFLHCQHINTEFVALKACCAKYITNTSGAED